MTAPRTQTPFAEEVPRLLADRDVSARELARRANVNSSHLSRLLRGADYRKAPSADLLVRIAEAFELPHDYFREYREAVVVAAIRRDSDLCEKLYERLTDPPG